MRIFLIGYMCSGKSTVGKRLAKRLNYDFIDLDDFFEENYHISIEDFFEKYNEEAYRKLENKLLNDLLKFDNVVISTGGGTPCFYDNMEIIKNNGVSIYLKMHEKSLETRILNSKKTRPVLKHVRKENLKEFIKNQIKEREEYYLKATYIIKGESVDYDEIERMLAEGKDKRQ